MKKTAAIIALAVCCAAQFACGTKDGVQGKTSLKTFAEQKSYMIGVDIAHNLKSLNTEIDFEALVQGLGDVMKERPILLPKSSMDSIRQVFTMQLREHQMAGMKASSEKNTQEGETFLAANKTKPGVITTASGLQYIIEKLGTGPKPKATDKVKVNYEGTLIDGKIFDSSIKRGQPVEFPVNGVIPGWTEALQLMPVGSKFKLFVPANLGYGDRGAGPDIGPGAVLIFEVELLGIVK
ncbi:MAG: FKBP-type peptidyl-prolyl cis-trans isomerase [Chitinispirillaceae bacterium]